MHCAARSALWGAQRVNLMPNAPQIWVFARRTGYVQAKHLISHNRLPNTTIRDLG